MHETNEQLRLMVLEEVVRGVPLKQVLEHQVLYMESAKPGTLCSVLLLDDSGRCLHKGAAPSLPDFYNAAIEGLQIGPDIGSCGAAAYHNRLTIVDDIQRHPNWSGFTALTERARLAACWSLPIHDSRGRVVGTFAFYHREPNAPNSEELELDLVGPVTDLAAMVVEQTQRRQCLLKEETWRRICCKRKAPHCSSRNMAERRWN